MTMHLIDKPETAPVDRLIIAIQAYRDGLAAYDAVGKDDLPAEDSEDDLHAALISGPEAVLANWNGPATSHNAAVAAVSLAEREKAIFGESAIADAMEAAAIAYWKSAGPSAPPELGSTTHVSLNDAAPDTLLRAPEAAAYLRASLATLARWRCTRRGPAFIKIGGNVAYQVSALRDFITNRERKSSRTEK